MKILMFSDTYGTVTTTFIRNEVKYFMENAEIVYVAMEIVKNEEGVKIYQLPYIENFFTRKVRWKRWQNDKQCSFVNLKYSKQLNKIIEKERPDVIHCHFAYEAIKIIQNISPQKKIPVFVHFHGYGASQMLRKKSYVETIKSCLTKSFVHPIFVSNYIEETLKKIKINVDKGNVLRCGIDLNKFFPNTQNKNKDEIIFLQVSSLAEKKGHEYTIRAFTKFFKKNEIYKEKVRIIFTGEGDRKEALIQLVRELDLQSNVKFIGNVSPDEAVVLMNEADVYVHHSIESSNGDKEGVPTSIMEAMAMKLPILSSFHAGISELVEHGVNGLLCNEKDIETYAQQIMEILHWKELNINRDKVERLYSNKNHNLQLERLYNETIR
jgi:colanic acid/amylovoran biosynthesis glycosyltransferase